MGGNYRRHVVAYADYFKDFKRSLDKASVAIIYQTFLYVMTFDKIPAKFFRSITSVKGLYEIRVEYESNIYRIFCCIDGDLMVLLNGFHKKSQKTPSEQIARAKKIMDEYYLAKMGEKHD